MCRTCCVCRFKWTIFGTVLSLNAAPRCCARKINTLDRQVIGSFFLIRPPWQGLVMHWPDFFSPGCPRGWSPSGTLACMMLSGDQTELLTRLFVGWCWLLNFSISIDSFTGFSPASSLLSVTSSDAFVQWSLGRHGQGLQIEAGKSDAVRAHETTWTIFTHYQQHSVYNSSPVSCYAK